LKAVELDNVELREELLIEMKMEVTEYEKTKKQKLRI
jgi:hypothetical protein